MKMVRRVFIAAIVLLIASVVFTLTAQAQTLKKIRIGSTTPGITTLPIEIAAQRGFFKDEGLQPEMITIRSSDIIIQALLSGQLDFSTALATLATAAAKRLPIKIVAVISKKPSFVMVSHPSIHEISNLKGKVVGIASFGGAADYAVRVALQKNGLDPKRDLTILQVGGSGARFAALQAGTIQATVLVAPFNLVAQKKGFRSLLWLGSVMDLPEGGLGASVNKLRDSPEDVVSTMKAIDRGIQFIRANRDETVKFMMKWLNLDRSIAEGTYKIVTESLADFGITDDKVIENALEAVRFQGHVDQDVSLSQLRDWSFAKKAQAEILQPTSPR